MDLDSEMLEGKGLEVREEDMRRLIVNGVGLLSFGRSNHRPVGSTLIELC